MQKRFWFIAIALVLCSLPLAWAVVYGQSEGIVRSTTLPSENVHMEAQQQATLVSIEQLSEVKNKLDDVQTALNSQFGDLKASTESQRTEVVAQLTAINREVGVIKGSVDSLQGLQQQVGEIRPVLEQPREIIPPMSLVVLSVTNAVLLIVVIVLIFWLYAATKAAQKDAHLEEHAQIHLTDFISEAMHKGASLAEIRRRLVQRGWNEAKIDEAMQEVSAMHAA